MLLLTICIVCTILFKTGRHVVKLAGVEQLLALNLYAGIYVSLNIQEEEKRKKKRKRNNESNESNILIEASYQ